MRPHDPVSGVEGIHRACDATAPAIETGDADRTGQHAPPILRDDLERCRCRAALGTLAVNRCILVTRRSSRLGTPQLAGAAIASIVLLNLVALVDFLEYVTPDIAFAVGAGREADARKVAGTGLSLALLMGIPGGLVVAALARPLCWLVGGRGDVLHHATTYLSISALGLPFILIAVLGHGVLAATTTCAPR
ncbi:MAG: MATE family efflux transporter [Ilumatobacteraceae bacterium]